MQLILRRRRRNTSLTALLWMANILNFPAKNWMSLFWVQCMSNIWHKDLSSNIFFLCTVEILSKHSKYTSIFTFYIHFWIIHFFLFPRKTATASSSSRLPSLRGVWRNNWIAWIISSSSKVIFFYWCYQPFRRNIFSTFDLLTKRSFLGLLLSSVMLQLYSG